MYLIGLSAHCVNPHSKYVDIKFVNTINTSNIFNDFTKEFLI
jgi:hypothetical protein